MFFFTSRCATNLTHRLPCVDLPAVKLLSPGLFFSSFFLSNSFLWRLGHKEVRQKMGKRKDRLRKVKNPQSTSTWTVKDFPISIRSYEVGSCLTSQVFTANHEAGSSCWRIFCYPNGACEEARGHVSLFISSQFSSQIVGNYHFDIGLLTACGEFLYHGILYGTVPYQKHGIPRFIWSYRTRFWPKMRWILCRMMN